MHPLRRIASWPAGEKRRGRPRRRDFEDSTCICLPARSRFGEGRGIFEHPAKAYLLSVDM
jgi:hypothetical protein